jgi:hypothetical protein
VGLAGIERENGQLVCNRFNEQMSYSMSLVQNLNDNHLSFTVYQSAIIRHFPDDKKYRNSFFIFIYRFVTGIQQLKKVGSSFVSSKNYKTEYSRESRASSEVTVMHMHMTLYRTTN